MNYLAIEREYGSGGTEIARRLSEVSGIPCYGTEILTQVSTDYGIVPERIERYEETVTNSFLYSMYLMGRVQAGDFDSISRDGEIFLAEQQVIRGFAAKGSGIFLGHCASEALKGYRGVRTVFIRADAQSKQARILRDYGIQDERSAASTARRFDKKRANYYYANTGKKWDDPRNYDLVLNSGTLGVDGCVAVLRSLLGGEKEHV